MTTVDFMKVGSNQMTNGQSPVKRQPCEGVSTRRALVSRSRSANAFSPCRLPSVARGHHATIFQSPPIIAGHPSAVAWSHPTAEGVPSTAEFAGKPAVQRKDAARRSRLRDGADANPPCHRIVSGGVSLRTGHNE